MTETSTITPPFCDTLYVSIPLQITPIFLRAMTESASELAPIVSLSFSDGSEVNPTSTQTAENAPRTKAELLADLAVLGIHENMAELDDLTPSFLIQKRRLEGFSAYAFTVQGVGLFAGFMMLLPERPIGDDSLWYQARVHLSASYLTACRSVGLGAAGAWASWCKLTAGLLHTEVRQEKGKPARVDIAADHWGYDWRPKDLRLFATLSRKRGFAKSEDSGQAGKKQQQAERGEHGPEGWTWDGQHGSTLYVGSRGAKSRFLRIYGKTQEAGARGKLPELEPFWMAHGWDGQANVWRAEVEHGSEWLADHGFKSIDDLADCERALWDDYTKKNRHTTGNNAKLRYAKTSPIWRKLQAASKEMHTGPWEYQPRAQRAGKDMRHCWLMLRGLIRRIAPHYLPQVGRYMLPEGASQGLKEAAGCETMRDAVIATIADLTAFTLEADDANAQRFLDEILEIYEQTETPEDDAA